MLAIHRCHAWVTVTWRLGLMAALVAHNNRTENNYKSLNNIWLKSVHVQQNLSSVTRWPERTLPTIGDKICWDTSPLKGLSDVLQTSKGENIAFPPPSPPCNVVPLFELTYRNTPTLNKEVWIALFSEVTPFEYNVSTILLPIVASKTIIL